MTLRTVIWAIAWRLAAFAVVMVPLTILALHHGLSLIAVALVFATSIGSLIWGAYVLISQIRRYRRFRSRAPNWRRAPAGH